MVVILVADSEPAIPLMIRGAFQQYSPGNHEVITAGTGEDAVALFAQRADIRVLIVDTVLLGMGARELVNAARRMSSGLRVFFMSMSSETELRNRGELFPAEPFLQKPFTLQKLVAAIEEDIHRLHIVVVEYEPTMVRMVEGYLGGSEGGGYFVQGFSSVKDAIESDEVNFPEVDLVVIGGSAINAYPDDYLEALHGRGCRARILVVSSEVRPLRAGETEFLERRAITLLADLTGAIQNLFP